MKTVYFKNLLLILSFCCSLLACAAENLLKNADFSDLTGAKLPRNWTFRGETLPEVTGTGGLTLGGDAAGMLAIQYQLPVKPGTDCTMSWFAAGKAPYKCYIEYSYAENGAKKIGGVHYDLIQPLEKGSACSFRFTVPANAEQTYIVFSVKSEEKVTVSNLKLVETAKAELSLALADTKIESLVLSPKEKKKIRLPELDVGKRYVIRYSVRGSGATGDTTIFHFFKLMLVDKFGGLLCAFPSEDCMETLQGKTAVFTAPDPEGHGMYLSVSSQSEGTLEFRDLRVEPFAGDGSSDRLVLTSPRFRGTFYSSIPEKDVAGHVIAGEDVIGGEAVLMTDSGKRFSCPLKKEGEVWPFAFPGESGRLEVVLKKRNGEEKILKRTIQSLPPAPVEVIAGPGRRLHINGKPFIHIEIARNGVPSYEQPYHGGTAIRRAIAATPEECLRILDRGQQDGLKVLLSFMNTVPRTADENKLRLWEHKAENILTKEVLEHPALLGYFLDDEPYWNGVSLRSLRRCYDVLCRLDPYHPVMICSAPRGTVEEQRAYADCCDIFGVDIYPVPVPNSHSHLDDKTLSCVGKYVRRMAEITDEVKPVSIVLQGFAWGDFNSKKKKIYPTRTESRFMVFDSVINGADAFIWYGLWLISNPEFYDDLMSVIRELHSLTGVISAESSVPGSVTSDAVEYRCYHGANWSCTLAANTKNESVTVRFSGVPGVPGEEQTFAPYEVKIFSEGELPSPLSPLPKADPEKLRYRQTLAARRDSTAYEVPADMFWIWGEKEKDIPKSRIFARVKFHAEDGLKSARFRFTADDIVRGVFLDGEKLEAAGRIMSDYHYLNDLDITSIVQPGDHILSVEAADAGGIGPCVCGLLAELRLEYEDGKIVSIPTNSRWETALQPGGPWTKAAELKKIGASPWGMPKLLKSVYVGKPGPDTL